MTKAPKEALRGAGRVAFLARVADFRKLVDGGHPLLGIYESNKDDLGISYSQFARYVAKYIRSPSREQEAPSAPQSAPAPRPAPPAPVQPPAAPASSGSGPSRPAGKPTTKPGAFRHDADSNKRDDLI
ncbi:TraK family protein [Stenotrophomonas acidaminiphila]|uniref:TraK family protein n=1 Tax=Stenotrophomonas acidaminiphila TaxID=128780 RepID=UPI0015FAA985|nr:TraK family protein [Stenotrophomonas acidaminiphila]